MFIENERSISLMSFAFRESCNHSLSRGQKQTFQGVAFSHFGHILPGHNSSRSIRLTRTFESRLTRCDIREYTIGCSSRRPRKGPNLPRCSPAWKCSSVARIAICRHTATAMSQALQTASILALDVSCSFWLPSFEICRNASTP